jgi:hypothetical protein
MTLIIYTQAIIGTYAMIRVTVGRDYPSRRIGGSLRSRCRINYVIALSAVNKGCPLAPSIVVAGLKTSIISYNGRSCRQLGAFCCWVGRAFDAVNDVNMAYLKNWGYAVKILTSGPRYALKLTGALPGDWFDAS